MLKIGECLDRILVVGNDIYGAAVSLRSHGADVEHIEFISPNDFMNHTAKSEYELIVFTSHVRPIVIRKTNRWAKTLYIGDNRQCGMAACHHLDSGIILDAGKTIIDDYVFSDCVEHIREAAMTHDYKCNFLSYNIKQSDANLLDVSCGRGVYLRHFRDKGLSVAGTEFSGRNVRYLEGHGINCRQVDLDIEEALPCPENSYDVVTCTEVLEHIQNPMDVVSEMMRVSRRLVLITTPVGVSYDAPDHIHHWGSNGELAEAIIPSNRVGKSISIHQVVSKPEDWPMNQRAFVVRIEV